MRRRRKYELKEWSKRASETGQLEKISLRLKSHSRKDYTALPNINCSFSEGTQGVVQICGFESSLKIGGLEEFALFEKYVARLTQGQLESQVLY